MDNLRYIISLKRDMDRLDGMVLWLGVSRYVKSPVQHNVTCAVGSGLEQYLNQSVEVTSLQIDQTTFGFTFLQFFGT